MANELKDILKRANKTKLIQLAIDSDNIGGRKLDTEEVEIIKNRAYKEGWDGELERATFKAKDIVAIGLEGDANIHKAMLYLEFIAGRFAIMEILLDELADDYIKDYNEETEKYETIVNKTDEELKKEVEYRANRVLVLTMSKLSGIQSGKLYGMYRHYFDRAKENLYLLANCKVGSYRLYRKEDLDRLTGAFMINFSLATEVINKLDHLEYLIEKLEEYYPKILEILKERKTDKIPNKAEITEIKEYLDNTVTDIIKYGEIGKLTREEIDNLYVERIVGDEYLFRETEEGLKSKLDDALNKLIEYVKYDR